MKTQEQSKIEGLKNKYRALYAYNTGLTKQASTLGLIAIISLLFNGFFIIAFDHDFIGVTILTLTVFFLFSYVNKIRPKQNNPYQHTNSNGSSNVHGQCYCTNPQCISCLEGGCTRKNCIVHSEQDKISLVDTVDRMFTHPSSVETRALKRPDECFCDTRQCGKCLAVGCTKNNCPVHTNEAKFAFRKKLKLAQQRS